jgi:hypothetical protein
MLRLTLLAICNNFRRKNWRFFREQMLRSVFGLEPLYVSSQNRKFFSQCFRPKNIIKSLH